LRGADLRRGGEQAPGKPPRPKLSTTPGGAGERGGNHDEIGALVRPAPGWRCVGGTTLPPGQDARPPHGLDKSHPALLCDIRRRIAEDSGVFGEADMVPLPCNPETISIGYGLRNGASVLPVTSMIPREQFVAIAPNAITFEKHPVLRDKFIELFSLSSGA